MSLCHRDKHRATVFANAIGDLTNANLSAVWAAWSRLAAIQAQTNLATVDIPAANAALATRVAQAAADNTANLATGVDDRASWLADLATNSNLAIAAAHDALTAADAGDHIAFNPFGNVVPAADISGSGPRTTATGH